MIKAAIFAALAAIALWFPGVFIASVWQSSARVPAIGDLLTGFVTNFFDTLGIGSFATTTAIFKFKRMVPDELIPGTLNVGHTLPVIFQAFIYMVAVDLDFLTLVLLIASATLGAGSAPDW